MTRYRCVFPRQIPNATKCQADCDCADCATRNSVKVSYEFDAPDKETLETWLNERGLEPLRITAMHDDIV